MPVMFCQEATLLLLDQAAVSKLIVMLFQTFDALFEKALVKS
jgi:hypothetical protein